MAHLGLGIGADDLQVPGGHEEALLLLRSRLVKQGGQEHAQVEVQRRGPSVHKAGRHPGWALGRAVGWERISNVHRGREEGEKKQNLCEYVRGASAGSEHCRFLRYPLSWQ